MNAGRVQIILFLFLILWVLSWVFFYFGLGQYFLMKQQISRLTGSEREMAEREFYAQDKAEHIFAGIIAKINYLDEGGVWVWSNQGLKYFQADEYTFYSYYDVCAAVGTPGEEFEINDKSREITTDIKQWANLVKAGDFVQLTIATPENGGQAGNLREIFAYSHPLFLSLELGRLCKS